jgi:hypothetical protein
MTLNVVKMLAGTEYLFWPTVGLRMPSLSSCPNVPPAVFDVDGIAPAPLEVGRLPERIEEHRGPSRCLCTVPPNG